MTTSRRPTTEVTDRQIVLSGSIGVGDFIKYATKADGPWWKVEEITRHCDGGVLRSLEFTVINKAGYRKPMFATTGAGRKFIRWVPPEKRLD